MGIIETQRSYKHGSYKKKVNQNVAHSYKKLLWKFRQNPWTALEFTKLSHRSQAQIGEPRHLSNDSKNQKRF